MRRNGSWVSRCLCGAFLLALPALAFPADSPAIQGPAGLGDYVALGWNELGMHCMNKTYDTFCILPPYNNVSVHLIKRGTKPQITTQGVTLSYRFPANTYSAGKVNFWDYEDKLFGVNLPKDIGLTGNGLTGTLKPDGQMLSATGIPVVPFDDLSPTIEHAYQLIQVTAKSNATSATLDQTTFCVPTSTEIHCDNCHSGGSYTVEQNILRKHDSEEGTHLMAARPILCGSCHSSNALGTPGKPGIASLSYAVHRLHGEEVSNISCYACHPGQRTQCLRGAMYLAGKTCTDCHGSIRNVASSISAGRRPWIDEPRCGSCHDANHSENANTLYRNSVGHGGLHCTACHNSPHSELPTAEVNDMVQAMRVQGVATYIKDCKVCHITTPSAPGPHGYRPATAASDWTIFQ